MTSFQALRTTAARLCLSACLLTTPASAQYVVKRIVFQGQTPYTQADMETASGLKPGAPLSEKNLQDAAQRLVNTGAFDDIRASLDGLKSGIDVIFQVKPIAPAHLLDLAFDNLVWWSPQELLPLIHQRVPLFTGRVSDVGSQQEDVTSALQALAAAKNSSVAIESQMIEAGLGHPVRTLHFRIGAPQILLTAIDIKGVPPNLAPAVKQRETALTGGFFTEARVDSLLSPWRDAGYLDAHFTDTQRDILPTATGLGVHITTTVSSGEPYHLTRLEWPGSPLLSVEQFNAAAKLHPGDLAAQSSLNETLKTVDEAYRQQGYLDAGVTATPTADPATHKVAYLVSVVPGDQYHMRSTSVLNLSQELRQQFDSAWKLTPGAVYDPIYATGFLKNNTALLPMHNMNAGFAAKADPDTHLVDLVVTFVHVGSR